MAWTRLLLQQSQWHALQKADKASCRTLQSFWTWGLTSSTCTYRCNPYSASGTVCLVERTLHGGQLQCVTGNNQLVTITPAVQKEELWVCTVKLRVLFVFPAACSSHIEKCNQFFHSFEFCESTRRAYLRMRDYVYAHMYIHIYIYTYIINTTRFPIIRILEVPPKLPVLLVKRAIKMRAFMKWQPCLGSSAEAIRSVVSPIFERKFSGGLTSLSSIRKFSEKYTFQTSLCLCQTTNNLFKYVVLSKERSFLVSFTHTFAKLFHKNISEVYLVLWPFPIKGCGEVGLKLVFQHKQVSSALQGSTSLSCFIFHCFTCKSLSAFITNGFTGRSDPMGVQPSWWRITGHGR